MKEIFSYLKDHPFIMTAILTLLGLFIGFIIDKIILRRLKRIAQKTTWEWDDAVISALHHMPFIWCTTAGLYAATVLTKFSKEHSVITKKILTVVILATVTIILSRLASGFIKITTKRAKGLLPSATLFNRITSILIYLIGTFIILQNLNIEITPLLTALGVGGLAVALALQDTLGNLFSGIQIMVTRQVNPGDYVKLNSGEEGFVTDIKGRNTTIRSFPNNNLIIVPNTVLVSSIVTNFNMPQKQLWVTVNVGVSYDSDLQRVEEITLEVAKAVQTDLEGAVSEVEPVLMYNEFGDSSINFTVRIYVKDFIAHYKVRSEFIKALHARYNQEGIEIPFPIRTLYMKNSA